MMIWAKMNIPHLNIRLPFKVCRKQVFTTGVRPTVAWMYISGNKPNRLNLIEFRCYYWLLEVCNNSTWISFLLLPPISLWIHFNWHKSVINYIFRSTCRRLCHRKLFSTYKTQQTISRWAFCWMTLKSFPLKFIQQIHAECCHFTAERARRRR